MSRLPARLLTLGLAGMRRLFGGKRAPVRVHSVHRRSRSPSECATPGACMAAIAIDAVKAAVMDLLDSAPMKDAGQKAGGNT